MAEEHNPFDAQAGGYDARAGLPEVARGAVARAVAALAGDALSRRRPLLEIGAGSGQIGAIFVAAGLPYVGLDLSLPMLLRFRARATRTVGAAGTAGAPRLLAADAAAPWPLADGAAGLVFASRSIHWLPPRHAAAEARRLLGPGGALLVGRVQRPAESAQERLRRQVHQRLRQAGVEPRRGRRRLAEVLAQCCHQGGKLIDPVSVLQWTVTTTPARALADWRSKPGLAGQSPPAQVKERVLAEVETWARHELGDLEDEESAAQTYVLEGVRFAV